MLILFLMYAYKHYIVTGVVSLPICNVDFLFTDDCDLSAVPF